MSDVISAAASSSSFAYKNDSVMSGMSMQSTQFGASNDALAIGKQIGEKWDFMYKVALIGAPNVGKSKLLYKELGIATWIILNC